MLNSLQIPTKSVIVLVLLSKTFSKNIQWVEIITWLLSYQVPYHPEERGINPTPKAERWCLFLKDDVRLDIKVLNHVIIYLSLIYSKIFRIYRLCAFNFVSSFISSIIFGLVRMLLGWLHYFLLIFISWTLSSYIYALFVFLSYGSGPNHVKISLNSVKGTYDIGHVVYDVSSMWSLILALIWISARISAQKLEFSFKRRFARFINRNLAISNRTYCNISG